MVGVLGINATWTDKKPSGVVLIDGSQDGWRRVAATPTYDSFLTPRRSTLLNIRLIYAESGEPTSGLEPLTCSFPRLLTIARVCAVGDVAVM